MKHFGTTSEGQEIHAVEIAGGGLTARLLTRGAILQSLRMEGVDHDLTWGSDEPSDYEAGMKFFGALVGPVVNRLGGAEAPIAGETHRFDPGPEGPPILHGGPNGTWAKTWEVEEAAADRVRLALTLPHGEGGFPGTRRIAATFSVAEGELRMVVEATTDRDTLINFANHSYWTPDGPGSWEGQTLRIAADHYLPVDDATVPTGEIRAVAGTPYDFREGRRPAPGDPPIDHNFCLSGGRQELREVLWLTGRSGLTMTLATTEPGVQIFDGRFPARPGGPTYQAFAVEAQGWPDAPNHAGFPSVALAPGETYRQETRWRFSRP